MVLRDQAQAAQQTENLVQAQKVVAEALSLDPTHAQALSLQAALQKRAAEQGKALEIAASWKTSAFRAASRTEGFRLPKQYVSPKIFEFYKGATP
ncbi:MAG: hypothetical protein ACE14M_07540 [Terriglobales bacterium]